MRFVPCPRENGNTVGYPAVAGPTEMSSPAQGKRGSFHPRGDSEFETEHTLSKKDLLGNRSRNAKRRELGKGPPGLQVHDAYFTPVEAETQRRQGNCPRLPSTVGTSAGRKPGGA